MTVKIRRGRPEDASVIARYNMALALESEDRELDLATVRAGVKRALEPESGARYFVAVDDGELVGQLMVTQEWSDWRDGEFWWIQSVYVAPDYRGRGIFRQLYEHTAGLARQNPDVCGLRLYMEQDNDTARAVYKQLGLSETGYLVLEQDFGG